MEVIAPSSGVGCGPLGGYGGALTVPRVFTNLALGAAYTPLAIGPDGLIYTENDGRLFVVGAAPGGAALPTSAAPTSNPPPRTVTDDSD
jgi:hypothetical protein